MVGKKESEAGMTDEAVALRKLSKFFLLVGNGDTLTALRGVIEKRESGASVEDIFKEVVAQARIDADNEDEPTKRLRNWANIAYHTGEESDLEKVEALLPKIHNPNQRALGKKLLARALAKSGYLEDARTLAGNIKSAHWRAEAFLEIHAISEEQEDLRAAEDACGHIGEASLEVKSEVEALIQAAKKGS